MMKKTQLSYQCEIGRKENVIIVVFMMSYCFTTIATITTMCGIGDQKSTRTANA